MNYFIRTQLYGIGKSKRLLGTLLFAPALLLFCSYNASSSWIPTQLVLAMFAALVSMLSSEILHWLMIDEVKDGLFDIILISPASRFGILLGKLFVPIVGSSALAIVSLLVNNCLAQCDHFVRWDFSLVSYLFLLFVATFSALLEFISLLITRRNNTNIHFVLLAGSIFLMLWIYDLMYKQLALFYIIIILLLIIAISLSLFLLRMRHQVSWSQNGYCFPYLFCKNKITVFGALLRKNISIVRYGKYTLLQFIVAVISPTLVGAIANLQNFLSVDAVVILSFSAIQSVTNIYIVFYSCLFENRNKVSEILQVQKFTVLKRVLEKVASATIISCMLCTISFLAIGIFYTCSIYILPFTIINCFLSAAMAGLYSHRICSFKAENIHKISISLISIALQFLLLFSI